MKRAILKWNKSNSEHTERDLRFNDTYNVGINYYHIMNRDEERHNENVE